MKIALFDDHPIILEALHHFFSRKKAVEIVGSVTQKSDVIPLLESKAVDILISDVLTDEALGLELFEEIQAKKLNTKVIVYSSLQSELVHHFLYEYGVVAIVNKAKGLDDLWQAVEAAYRTTAHQEKTTGAPPPSLTAKEKEIIQYIVRGLAAKEIAELTQSSVNTINNQKNHLLVKFECANTAELVSRLTQLGYINL